MRKMISRLCVRKQGVVDLILYIIVRGLSARSLVYIVYILFNKPTLI